MRLFFAYNLSPKVKSDIDEYIKKISLKNLDYRWTALNNLHITLKFLGEFNPVFLEEVYSSIDNLCRNTLPFNLTISGLGAFPSINKPRILWIGFNKSTIVMDFFKEFDLILEKVGIPKEDKPYLPHITIGRHKKTINLFPPIECIESSKETIVIDNLTLFSSMLKPVGSIYKEISKFPLTID
jgi:2'-5' RNA ligase